MVLRSRPRGARVNVKVCMCSAHRFQSVLTSGAPAGLLAQVPRSHVCCGAGHWPLLPGPHASWRQRGRPGRHAEQHALPHQCCHLHVPSARHPGLLCQEADEAGRICGPHQRTRDHHPQPLYRCAWACFTDPMLGTFCLSPFPQHTMRFGTIAKVLAKCELKYCRSSECTILAAFTEQLLDQCAVQRHACEQHLHIPTGQSAPCPMIEVRLEDG